MAEPAHIGRYTPAVAPPSGLDIDDSLVQSGKVAYGQSSEPLRSVRVGRRMSTARLPRWLDLLRSAAKRVAWVGVEARRVNHPVRYARRELVSGGRGDYQLRGGGSHFSVRHRTGDVHIFRKFYAYGYYSPPAQVAAKLSSLERAVSVLDLGANIGLFEVFTREHLPIGRVVCFEPEPSNAAILERARAANGCDWEIVRACASNSAGRVRFNTGRENFSRIADSGDADIEAVDVLPYIAEADLVKMNIEGSEWEILKDPRFAQTSATWIIEYHRIANPEPEIHQLVRRLFEDAGYRVSFANQSPENGLMWSWKP